jgi:hypothetical protein
MNAIRQDFRTDLDSRLTALEQGVGRVEHSAQGIRLRLDRATDSQYSNAQIDDYLRRKEPFFTWRPPLRMTVRAWASHNAGELKGTAGFGFWTQPVMPGKWLPILPRAVWFFFSSPPSNMAFARGVPGYGWKAATLDAGRLPFLLLLPTAPLGFLLMRVAALYRALWPIGQWAVGASEAILSADLRQPHTYRVDWLPGAAAFYVDDQLVHRAPFAPRGPLGFVAWLDNRWAVVTPQGNLGMGLLPVPESQWLSLETLSIEPLAVSG